MELDPGSLRAIRLEHIHQTLRHRTIQKTLNLCRIEEIRELYGFKSRDNFAALYKKYFEKIHELHSTNL
ncbi:hypothetical protein [Synechococcus sp. MIT S1220]|uniref:hypothetical protein n=1 Tax=Synechococcus sp. MIT S1220 TaxID=3082549 RepID=UPI0039B0D155